WRGLGSCGCRDCQKGARSGARASPAAGSGGRAPGPQALPAPPRTRHEPQTAPVRPPGPPPRRPPPPYRNGSLAHAPARPRPRAPPADGPAVRQPPRLAANSPAIEILRQRADGAKLEIARKDRANRLRLGWYHKDLLVHGRIAEWDRAADPNAFALRGSDLVAHPLPDQLAFELGK